MATRTVLFKQQGDAAGLYRRSFARFQTGLCRVLHTVTHCRKHWQYILSTLIVGVCVHLVCVCKRVCVFV